MTADRPRTRLFVESALASGGEAPLSPGQAHYLGRVLRMGTGDRLLAFNGRDGEWLAEVGALTKSAGTLRLLEKVRPQPAEPGPWLLFAPLKGGRTEYVVEKAVELGVGAIQPVFTRRSDVNRVNQERMRANAVEAAEQCERLSVPEVREAADLLRVLEGWDAGRTLFVAAESGRAEPLVMAVTARKGQPAAWLIGPEGGFDSEELDALRHLPFVVPVGLGPRILRADTAAFAALAAWQALAGDWTGDADGVRPPFRA
ncbi:16S rRNA (uracil(1498)-N(3))-methyltransferase [Indioceanicola profundi]|uniref:16S rRNA (uracil(1498)-N(3))-methyltransferase n=1 Tax=Indioceanicola profundi TaxID=2220096 RepID=UPI000E6AB8EA|nr:16S rRNA (uracil(1498)-N(3))-methyltransferase [Indioceanicola profundi]